MNRIISSLLSVLIAVATVQADGLAEINPLAEIKQTPGFCSIFHSWGFIGDSLSSGEHEHHKEDGTIGWADLYDYSWGARMCAAMGVEGKIYAQGGETAEGWIRNFWEKPHNNNGNIDAKLTPHQAYVIALGVNDKNLGLPVGNADNDICMDDFSKNAGTYAGAYGGIIQRIKSIAPDAKIFVVTAPRHIGTNDSYNDVVRAMADKFDNIYVIDLYKYAPDYDGDFYNRYFMGGHLTAAGYQLTAWMMMTYIDSVIRANIHDFDQVAFINTPYRY